MPWKEVTSAIERMKFVTRLNAGERMSDLCREFGISHKTENKFERMVRRAMTFRAGPDG